MADEAIGVGREVGLERGDDGGEDAGHGVHDHDHKRMPDGPEEAALWVLRTEPAWRSEGVPRLSSSGRLSEDHGRVPPHPDPTEEHPCSRRRVIFSAMTPPNPSPIADELDQLVTLSNLIGRETRLVQPGGGNTSIKTTLPDASGRWYPRCW